MKFLGGMSMALYAGMLQAEISDEMIERALEWRRDGHGIKRGGPLDVRLGRIMRASEFLGAARYYVPEIKTGSKITLENGEIRWKREYGKDCTVITGEGKSLPPPIRNDAARYKERYYQTMIYMFPSVGGSVDIGRGEGDSLVRFLKSQDEGPEGKKSPKILAALMAMGLGVKLDGDDASSSKSAKIKKSGEKNDIRIRHHDVIDVSVNLRKSPSVRNIIRFFEDGAEYESNRLDEEFHLLSKESLLHAFIHYHFREYEELKRFIGAFYDIIRDNNRMLEKCFVKENKDNEAFSRIYRAVTDPKSLDIVQTTPFTPATPQIRSEGAYFYNRRGAGGRGEFRRDDKFGDCIEMVLLSSLYYLFFDPLLQRCRIKESCSELKGTALAAFIKDYPEPGAMDDTKKERWLEIVEDLDEERIVYCKHRTDDEGHQYRGELCSGLINFLRVVVKICGLDASEYLSGFAEYREKPSEDDEKRIKEEFKEQFEKVIDRLCDKEVTISYPCELKMERVGQPADSLGWDIAGSVGFNMKDEMRRNGRFTLVQQDIHAKLEIRSASVSMPENKLNELRRDIDGIGANTESQLAIHLQYAFAYFMTDVSQFDEYFREFYERLVNSPSYCYLGFLTVVRLESDEQKMAVLRKLFPSVVGNGYSYVEQVVENIVNSLGLNVDAISRSVHPLVAFNTRLRERYGAILDKHAVPPGSGTNEQRYWVADYKVRKQCIQLFYDKPELLMYLDGIDIAETIERYEGSMELREAVRQIPDAGMRSVINVGGVVVACKHGKTELGQYFLGELETMDDAVLEAEVLYYIHYDIGFGKDPDFNVVTKFFTDQVETASDETIRKMYSWCFSSKGVHCIYSDVLPYIRATHKKVGMGFVFDQVMGMGDLDRMENFIMKNENLGNIINLWSIVRLYSRFYKSLIEWMQAEGIELRQDVYDQIKDYIGLMGHESQVEGSKYFKEESADKIEEFCGRLVELKNLLEKVGKSNRESEARAIIYPELLHLSQRILPLKHERLDEPDLQNRIGTIVSNYEHGDWDLVRFAERNNRKPKYVSAKGGSIAAFFQLVSSKAIDILSYQRANNTEPGPSGDFNDLYISDETGHFKNFLTIYHENANGKLRKLVLTVEEWERVQEVMNALTPSTVVRETARNKEQLHKPVFSRNIYALAHPLFEQLTPEMAAGGDSDVDESAGSGKAMDEDNMQRLFNLVGLFHNITSDRAVLEPGDKMDYLLSASLLYPFKLHYKELNNLEGLEVVASCCKNLGEDRNDYPTYLFRWEEIGLPEGYEDNYHLFCYRTIYELTRPVIESIRRSNPERADIYTREFESIHLVDNFDPRSDRNILDEFIKSLKGKRNFTGQANMILFMIDQRFGYIRPAGAERE